MKIWDPIDIAWVAGIIEGEGSINNYDDTRRVAVSMTDEDTIKRLHEITGIGHITTYTRKEEHCKQVWSWQVHEKEEILRLLTAIVLFMGERRTKALLEVSDAIYDKYVRRCEGCQAPFIGTIKYQAFCSKKCYNRKPMHFKERRANGMS